MLHPRQEEQPRCTPLLTQGCAKTSQFLSQFQDTVRKLLGCDESEVLVTQLGPSLCDLMDCSPPGSSVHGILQTRTLEWIAISFSRDLPDPGVKLGSPRSRQTLYRLSHQGSLRL